MTSLSCTYISDVFPSFGPVRCAFVDKVLSDEEEQFTGRLQ